MRKEEKSLVKINEDSFFNKIKTFIKKIFNKKDCNINNVAPVDESLKSKDNRKQKFMEEVKRIEDEETKLLKLQQQFHNGEINEEDLTETQYKALNDLYDRQIDNLKKSIEIKKQKIKKMQEEGINATD